MSQITFQQLRTTLSLGTLNNFVNGTLIPSAERYIDSYVTRRGMFVPHMEGTFRHFNPHGTPAAPGTITLDGSGKAVLFIPPRFCPPINFGTINIGAGTVPVVTDVKLHTQYVDYDGGVFTEGKLNVDLIGSYGYTSVPADVEMICARLCANLLLDMVRRYQAEDVTSVAPGHTDFTTMFASPALFASPTIFTPDMKSQLDEYRLSWVNLG